MRDYITFGPVPAEESCAQVGEPDYESRAKAECTRFLKQIRTQFGNEPSGARLRVKGFSHDLGRYHEVVCEFDVENEVASNYAFNIDTNVHDEWFDRYITECNDCGGSGNIDHASCEECGGFGSKNHW